MIITDKNYYDFTLIDTEEFLRATIGEPLDLEEISTDLAEKVQENWLMEVEHEIEVVIEGIEGQEYERTQVYNTYNNENDFSADFQYCIFYPAHSWDHLYSQDCYVAIEPHLGGDPRGNYGPTRIYKVDCIAETGFYDRQVSWYAEPLNDFREYNTTNVDFRFPHGLAYNNKLDDLMGLENDFELVEKINEECSVGYSQNPTYRLSEQLDGNPEYSEALECFVGKLHGGALVKLSAYINVPY